MEQFDVDVVICNVKLPDGNGVELSNELKNKYTISLVTEKQFDIEISHFACLLAIAVKLGV